MNIGKRLALVRQSRGMTIEEVSDKVVKSYDRIETGKINLKFNILLQVCEVLKIDVWDLLAEKLVITYSENVDFYSSTEQFNALFGMLGEMSDDIK